MLRRASSVCRASQRRQVDRHTALVGGAAHPLENRLLDPALAGGSHNREIDDAQRSRLWVDDDVGHDFAGESNHLVFGIREHGEICVGDSVWTSVGRYPELESQRSCNCSRGTCTPGRNTARHHDPENALTPGYCAH